EGKAFRDVNRTLSGDSIEIGASAVGLARAAYETALEYASERRVWGCPIREHESVASKLVEMRMYIEATRTFIWKLCWAEEHPQLSDGLDRMGTMAKIYATSLIQKVVADAMQILGAYGYTKDYPLEKYMRDAMAMPIRGTTNEVLKIFLAREL
ncbi:unnamed protein product, partial [marine sediment metagenome]